MQWRSRPSDKGGGASSKKFFSKTRGGWAPRAPLLDPPLASADASGLGLSINDQSKNPPQLGHIVHLK